MKEYIIKIDEENENDGSQRVLETSELVRCKDCKYRTREGHCYVDAPPVRGLYVSADWFCAYGERYEGEADERETGKG